MTIRLLAAAISIAAFGATPSAFAQDNMPVEAETEIVTPKKKGADDVWLHADANLGLFQFSSTDGDTIAVTDNLGTAQFRAGVKYKYFGAEIEYGTGLSDLDEDGAELGLESQFAILGIARLPGDDYDIFLRAGYHESDFDVSFRGRSATLNSNGFVFGIGGTYYFTDNFGVRADITGYNTRDIVDAGFVGGNLGLTARF